MSQCGCEGSCPVCTIGEVDNHKCNKCGADFCPKCHGTVRPSIMPCQCSDNTMESLMRQYEETFTD
jgi:hypothetical protein